MNIYKALEYGVNNLNRENIDEPILKCRILLAHLLNKEKEYLVIHEDEVLSDEVEKRYVEGIDKLSRKIPIQYITNKQEFMGLSFFVNENVLIPQPDTEILVEEVINICKDIAKENENKNVKTNINVLDLCTGSGAIGISILNNVKETKVALSDISIDALDVVNINIKNLVDDKGKNRIKTINSDLFEKIDDRFDVIVSNPPYIKTNVIDFLEDEVKNEPLIALDGGEDGLKFYKLIINEADKFLNDNGYLCLEIGFDQKEEVIKIIKQSKKYESIYSKKDLGDNDRIIICKKVVKKDWTNNLNVILLYRGDIKMKNEEDSFLNYALNSGRIKPFEDAFDDFPVEEEDHKGNAYYYIEEEQEEYNRYSVGDIVFVRKYKYKDGSEGKDHLFVIIEENNILIPIEYLSMLISSNLSKLKFDSNVLLKKDNINHLKKDSIVKTDIIYKIKLKDILFKVGQVSIEQIEEYREKFKRFKED